MRRVGPPAPMGRRTSGAMVEKGHQAEDRQNLPLRRGAAGASFHSGSRQYRQGVAAAIGTRTKYKERGPSRALFPRNTAITNAAPGQYGCRASAISNPADKAFSPHRR